MWKLRLWDDSCKPVGRLTWLSIFGVPLQCWSEEVFTKIAERWGPVMELANCSLDEAQSLVVGKVLIQTLNVKPVEENLFINVNNLNYPIRIAEDLKDIISMEMKEEQNHDSEEADSITGFSDESIHEDEKADENQIPMEAQKSEESHAHMEKINDNLEVRGTMKYSKNDIMKSSGVSNGRIKNDNNGTDVVWGDMTDIRNTNEGNGLEASHMDMVGFGSMNKQNHGYGPDVILEDKLGIGCDYGQEFLMEMDRQKQGPSGVSVQESGHTPNKLNDKTNGKRGDLGLVMETREDQWNGSGEIEMEGNNQQEEEIGNNELGGNLHPKCLQSDDAGIAGKNNRTKITGVWKGKMSFRMIKDMARRKKFVNEKAASVSMGDKNRRNRTEKKTNQVTRE